MARHKMSKSARYHKRMTDLGLKKVSVFVANRDVENVKDHGRGLREGYFKEIGHDPYAVMRKDNCEAKA